MVSIGAQWVVLQSVAWIGMAVSYSVETGSLSDGLSMTFDGEHPCPLCCAIEVGTESEDEQPYNTVEVKVKQPLDDGRPSVVVVVPPAPLLARIQADGVSAPRRGWPPPLPPPQSV